MCQVVTQQGEEQWNLVIQAVARQINLCSWSLLCIGHIIVFLSLIKLIKPSGGLCDI